ncbi:hypothetical protein ACIQZI_19600 [Peribacillus sp. NPDC096379]|uniref:hypothetical protein n=1 Tax=Peribacillus sp. NPDC096379 TaxID=3364393 RepID=UPI00381A6768
MNQDDQDKKQIEEHKKNPMGNFSDSINRSMIGDLGALTKGGCLIRVITLVIIIGGLLILSQCSY